MLFKLWNSGRSSLSCIIYSIKELDALLCECFRDFLNACRPIETGRLKKLLAYNSTFSAALELTLVRQLVNVIVAQPEFSFHVTESILVVIPVSVEVDGSIKSSLDDCPA